MKVKKILSIVLCLGLVLSCGLFSITSKAQTLKEDNNPEFKECILDGVDPGGVYYKPDAKFVQDQSAGSYSINTNANVLWWNEDGAALLCKKYALDYGDLSTLTVEATVKSLESTGSASAIHESASAGIIIRNSEQFTVCVSSRKARLYLDSLPHCVRKSLRGNNSANRIACLSDKTKNGKIGKRYCMLCPKRQ